MKVSKLNSKNKNQPNKQKTYLAATCGDVQPHEHGIKENRGKELNTQGTNYLLFLTERDYS